MREEFGQNSGENSGVKKISLKIKKRCENSGKFTEKERKMNCTRGGGGGGGTRQISFTGVCLSNGWLFRNKNP